MQDKNNNIKAGNNSFETVEQFKYLGTILKNQNSINEGIKSRLRSGNACCHSVQNLLSSSLLSKNIKTKIHRTKILPVVLYGCETWSLTFREECRLRVYENKALRRILRPKRDEVTGEWRKLHKKYHADDKVKKTEMGRVCSTYGKKRDAYRILAGKPDGKRPLGRPRRR
jgi:hypothetical protein